MRGRGAQTLEELFTQHVRVERGRVEELGHCWNYYGRWNDGGYGVAYIKGYSRLFHRYVWEYVNGTIPDKMELDHLCQTRQCCNPDHLEPVTGEVNRHRIKNPVYRAKTDREMARETAELISRMADGDEDCEPFVPVNPLEVLAARRLAS